MTLTEKILARASGKARVQAGDNVWVKADVLMTHDVCGPGTIGVFKREFGRNAKVWDHTKVVIIPDHYIFTADSKSNRNVDILRDFVNEQGITYFYDVIDDPKGHWVFDSSKGKLQRQYGSNYAGVCHTALPAKGHTRPGEILFGTDSHTCMAGAFNEFATGIGNTDAGFVLGTGKLLLKVPETMHFQLEGGLQPGVMAKDIILHCIGEIGFDGATYRAMQFDGQGVANLTMDDRMTIANMAIEAGGKNGIFEFDSQTQAYVDYRCKLNGTKILTSRSRATRTKNSFTRSLSICPSLNRRWLAIQTLANASSPENSGTSNSTGRTSVHVPAARRATFSNLRVCCEESVSRSIRSAFRLLRRLSMTCKRRAGDRKLFGKFWCAPVCK